MRYLFIITTFCIVCAAQGQEPDIIKISTRDTLRDITDCFVKITVGKKNLSRFQFPSEYRIANELWPYRDLVVVIQRQIVHEFKDYWCERASLPHFDIRTDSIKYKWFHRIDAIDSLEDFKCLAQGHYRMQVRYDKRPINGEAAPANYVLASKWSYFYVVPKEIILNRYYYYKSKEQK